MLITGSIESIVNEVLIVPLFPVLSIAVITTSYSPLLSGLLDIKTRLFPSIVFDPAAVTEPCLTIRLELLKSTPDPRPSDRFTVIFERSLIIEPLAGVIFDNTGDRVSFTDIILFKELFVSFSSLIRPVVSTV